jgi:Hemerythrin HHE cation binding domain
MTITESNVLRAFEVVTFNTYRDIHKGIRGELFAVTSAAGCLDPADHAGRADLAGHIVSVVDLLVTHAHHEDTVVQPVLEAHLPCLAETVAVDHPVLEARIEAISDLAQSAVNAPAFAQRGDLDRLYLELASFTSAYLAHQDFEERDIMPALERAVGFDGVMAIHVAIVGSLTPEETASTLPLMMRAMNIEDRVELLGGMQRGAPPEAFAQVFGLVRSSLAPCEGEALAKRLGIV